MPAIEVEFYGRLRKCLQPLVQYCIILKQYYRRNSSKKRVSHSEQFIPNLSVADKNESEILDEEALERI
jgi:hypothetical protein